MDLQIDVPSAVVEPVTQESDETLDYASHGIYGNRKKIACGTSKSQLIEDGGEE